MKALSVLLFYLLSITNLLAQTGTCPEQPPTNPWLADSPWPTFHYNAYRQASTCIKGPVAGDQIVLKSRLNMTGGTSPWVYLSEKYPNGKRVLVQSNATHFFKHIDTEHGLQTVDSLRIDFEFIKSFGYAFLQTKGNKWFVPDPKYDPQNNEYSRIVKIEDADPTDPLSKLVKSSEYSFEKTPVNKVLHLMLNFNGEIVFTATNDQENSVAHVGILDQNLEVQDIFEYPTFPNEIVSHNSSPIDENNSWYLVTTHRLIRFDWDGTAISIGWEASYDFVNDGPTGSFAEGSGTTPTLLGYGTDEDKLVVVADGHNKNNLVAFWRELPAGWSGIPGQDIRYAAAIPIPLAQASNNTFQSIENSPTASGYSIAIAQFNGFLGYECENDKGVQKFTWNSLRNNWELDWSTDALNMNGVLTYSKGSNLLYSSGKESDCIYYMYGINWDTGQLDLRIPMGPENTFLNDPYYDAGNNTIIDEFGNLFMPGGKSLIKLEIQKELSSENFEVSKNIILSPNPAKTYFDLKQSEKLQLQNFKILDASGRIVEEKPFDSNRIFLTHLPSGLYFIQLNTSNNKSLVKRFIKK